MSRKISLVAFILYILFSATAEAQDNKISFLDPDSFNIQYNQEVFAILIDARIEKDYRSSRITGAINIPSKDDLSAFSDTLDHEIPLYIYCSSETRSIAVAEFLISKEFNKLIILEGGFLEWKSAGLPVETKRNRRK